MSSSFITRSPRVEEAGSWSSPKAPPSRQSEAARSCGCVPASIANRPARPPGWRSSHFGRRAVTTWEGAASERYCGGMLDGKVETLRAVIEAVNRRDLDALSKLRAPDVEIVPIRSGGRQYRLCGTRRRRGVARGIG